MAAINPRISIRFVRPDIWKDIVENFDFDINQRDSEGQTALTQAANIGNEDMVENLLKIDGIDVDAPDKAGITPLWYSLRRLRNYNCKAFRTMAAAIIKKADVNKRDKDGSHPLTWAIRENIDEAPPPPHFTSQKLSLHQCHKRLIPLLLEKKELDVERIESDGESPFFAVIDGGNSLLLKPRNLMPSFAEPQWYEVQKRKEGINVLILKDLLSSGRFNVNILNDDSRSPLSLAVERSSLRVVQTLLDSPNIKVCSQDKDGRTPLIWSILGNRADTMEAILAQDDSGVDTPDRSGRKPLSWASEKADLKMVRSLVQKCGDNVDTPDCNGRSPLSWAVQTEREPALTSGAFENNQLAFDGQAQGEPPIIRFLIDTCGADPNSKDNDERTPLSWAATTKNPSIVKYMAQKAENVNEPDKGGRSPLSWSAEQGTLHVVRYLLSHESINVNIEDCNGQTPLSWATRQHNKDMIVLFLQKDTGTLHSMARRATDIDKIKLLLEAGYDASKRNSRGENPLYRAVEAGNLKIAELLVDHCPESVKWEDRNGVTPLRLAIYQSRAMLKLIFKNSERTEEIERHEWFSGNEPDPNNNIVCLCREGDKKYLDFVPRKEIPPESGWDSRPIRPGKRLL